LNMPNRIFLPAALLLAVAVFITGCRSNNNNGGADSSANAQIFQYNVRQAGDKVFPALVYVKVVQEDRGSGRNSSSSASGSGVIISPRGEIVTNNHVIDKAVSIRCLLNDGRAFEADLIGSDKDTDLALLKLKLPEKCADLPYAEFSREEVREGDFVMALGAPWGLNRSISIGIISCARRYLPGHSEYSLWYQTDASISPGNSGGPLINTQGRIVGINTLGRLGGGDLGFTIPASTVETVVARLRQYGKANWAWFGLKFQPLKDFERNIYQPFEKGALISGLESRSPALKAGFEVNDLVLAVNGEAVNAVTAEDLPALYRKLGLMPFSKEVDFTVLRDGKTLHIKCMPMEKGKVEGEEVVCERWGFSAKSINRFDNPDLYFYRPEGVFVFGITPFSPASRSKLLKNDIIVKVNQHEIVSLEDLQEAYLQAEKISDRERRSVLTIMRNGVTLQLTVYLKDK